MPSLTIRHDNGTTDTIPATIRTEIKREIGRMRRGRLTVERSLAEDANLVKKQDVVEIPNEDNLILVDIEKGGSTWVLVCYSWEWLGNTVEPTDGGQTLVFTDKNHVRRWSSDNVIGSTWTDGVSTSFTGQFEFTYNHTTPNESIRRIEKNIPGEVQFRDEGVVDYLDQLGIDRSNNTRNIRASDGLVRFDVSDDSSIDIDIKGAGGGSTNTNVNGGSGGEINGLTLDVSSFDTISVQVGESGGRSDASGGGGGVGGRGYINGGDGGDGSNAGGAGGGGSSVVLADGTEIIKVGGGGGGGGDGGGGGGAAGGDGGTSTNYQDGDDAAGSGFGGDGGDSQQTGKDGDASLLNSSLNIGSYIVTQGGGAASGQDGSATISSISVSEISAAAETIENEIEITERGRDLDGTHIRLLGAHEGEAQVFTNLVPSSDPDFYENDVRYSTPRWSSSSDTEWNIISNKDAIDQTTADRIANSIADELKDNLVEAKATVSDVDLNIGDTVNVKKPDADLDKDMRIVRLKDIQEGATQFYEVLLSTRNLLSKDEDDDLKDIQRFNKGYQGTSTTINAGPVVDGVDSGDPLKIPFRYPSIAFENKAELYIESEEFRYTDKQTDPGIFTTTDTASNVDVVINGTTVQSNIGSGTFQKTITITDDLNQNAWNTVEIQSDSLGRITATVFIENYNKIGQT